MNNAGYGLSGPFEELEDEHVRKQMEVNFFGLMAVTKKAMEVMRDQTPSGGLIQQVTSIAGQRGYYSCHLFSKGWMWELLTDHQGGEFQYLLCFQVGRYSHVSDT